STKKMNLKPEFNAFLNYWFRHVWEYVWPVYAALLFFEALSGIPLKTIILYQAPFTVLNIVTGLIVSFLYFKKHNIKREKPQKITTASQTMKDLFEGVWPILLVILLFFILSVPLHISLVLVALILTLIKRLKPKEIANTLFNKNMGKIILLISSVMIFKQMIEVSNAFETLRIMEVSVVMVVGFTFLVSFSMGFLTGVNNAFIVISYPILLPLIQSLPPDHFVLMSVYVYVIGFAGILLSPVHFCLVLTNEYFKSNLYHVYRYLAPPGNCVGSDIHCPGFDTLEMYTTKKITKGVAPPTYYCIGSGKSHWEEKEGSHGLHQGSFRLRTMTALIKSFCGGGSRGGNFFKKRPPWPPEAKNESACSVSKNHSGRGGGTGSPRTCSGNSTG
ncbi:DUF401 family protein, partial [Acidobacteriota bacterium]